MVTRARFAELRSKANRTLLDRAHQPSAIAAQQGRADWRLWPDALRDARGAAVARFRTEHSREVDFRCWLQFELDPHALRADGYRFFARLLANNFRHVGALRIDHVMGFERLFWIPQGRPAAEGAYVRYPREELLGVLALESRRQRAVAVGEDLGTVPADLPAALASWGILSSSVLTFGREGTGFCPAQQIPARALASANTHDLAPLAGWLAGRDIELRHSLGESADAADDARAQAERAAWLERLRIEGLLPATGEPSPADWCRATSAFLAKSPARLVAVSLDDLAGEIEPLHLPGIGSGRYPGCCRRMGRELEALAAIAPLRAGLPQLGRVADTLPQDAEGA